jgi:pyruvate,water dikinase
LYGTGPVQAVANRLVTQPWVSRLAAAPTRLPGSAKRIDGFVQAHGIDLSECSQRDWPSFAAFFTRRPRPGARPIDPNPAHLIAPADSKLLAAQIRPGLTVNVKGVPYSVPDLLGDAAPAAAFEGGWCLVFRLSVDDFHHYVYQAAGHTLTRRWIPGRLDTVGPASGRRPVLVRNQRLVSVLSTESLGLVGVVAVGALTVGRIVDRGLDRFARGQTEGRFEVGGSTLVVLLEPGRVKLDPDIWELSQQGIETKVALGSRIGLITAPSKADDAAAPAPRSVAGGQLGCAVGGVVAGAAGPKAAALARLQAADLPVPEFTGVPVSAMREALTPVWAELTAALALPEANRAVPAAQAVLADLQLGPELDQLIQEQVQPGVRYAVRSSAVAEDGRDRSAAGCYLTRLNVPAEQVGAAVLEVWRSAFAAPALAYTRLAAGGQRTLAESLVGVVIQPMIEAAMSGVVFTANPTGPVNEMVITVGQGVGAGVDDAAELATYLVCQSPAEQALLISAHRSAGAPHLERETVEQLVSRAQAAAAELGGPADVEFGIDHQGKVWLLQARPVTTLGGGQGVILDNSNIVESYPGLSRALTASFAGDIYHHVFRALAERLGSPAVARRRDPQLRQMVAWWGGRMYYQISNWYALLTLLPFQRVVVDAWQNMLGVRERAFTAGRGEPWPRRLRMWAALARSVAQAPSLVADLHERFVKVEAEFWRRLAAAAGTDLTQAAVGGGGRIGAREASEIYRWLAAELAPRWDVTLINDVYAFAFTSALNALAGRSQRGGAGGETDSRQPTEAAARLIAQGRPLVSLEPLVARQELALTVGRDPALADFLEDLDSDAAVRAWLATGQAYPDFAQAVAQFIDRYGDRSTGELKLETPTARSHPNTLLRTVLGEARTPGAADGERQPSGIGQPDGDDAAWLFPRRHRRLAQWLARHARAGVAARELSRLDRSRLFGMVRQLFYLRGEELERLGQLDRAEDVTHLTIAEALAPGGPPEGRALVSRRAEELAAYGRLPAYPRVVFAGELLPRQLAAAGGGEAFGAARERAAGLALRGEGCSPGDVQASVLVVRGPLEAGAAAGKVLVTEVTDPGWVFHLATAAGVVSEKGSLLSHTAIVARELGVPFVAGIAGATSLLVDGDVVRIDGAAGTVELVTPSEPAGADPGLGRGADTDLDDGTGADLGGSADAGQQLDAGE